MPDYFVGPVAMHEVERQLRQHGGIGGYVVRESATRKGQWTISLKISTSQDCIRHYPTRKENGFIYVPDIPNERFTDLQSLISKWSHLCVQSAGYLFAQNPTYIALRPNTPHMSSVLDSMHLGGTPRLTSAASSSVSSDYSSSARSARAGTSAGDNSDDDDDIDIRASPSAATPSYLKTDLALPGYIDDNGGDLYITSSAAKRMFDKKVDYSGMTPPRGISATALRVIKAELMMKYGPQYKLMKTYDVSEAYVKPPTKNLPGCPDPVDQTFLNYMDRPENQVRFADHSAVMPVGPSTVFVSHAWAYHFHLVMDVMLTHAEGQEGEVYFWFDMFTNSQHDTSNRPYEWWQNTFKSSIGVIGQMLLVMMPWNCPIPMTRAWCLFEILSAIEEQTKLWIGMPGDQQDMLVTSLSTGDSQVLQNLGDIDAKKAEASNASDKTAIFQVIEQTCGFSGLNDKVKEHLRNWIIDTAEYHANKVDLGLELLTSVAKLFQRLGKTELSQTLYERRLLQARTRFDEYHPMVGQAWANLGAVFFEMREPAKAIECSRKALKIFETIDAQTPDICPEREKDMAMTYVNLGHAYKRTGHPKRAKDCYARAEELSRQLVLRGGVRATKEVKKTFANTSSAVGVMLRYFKHPELAIPKHKEALAMKALLGLGGELSTAVIYHNLALAHKDVSQFREAAEALQSALHIRRIILGDTHTDTINTMRVLDDVESRIPYA